MQQFPSIGYLCLRSAGKSAFFVLAKMTNAGEDEHGY